ncbi:zinc-dependent alcohol dehydrogenase [Fundicoccus culcitae]|uniref:Zinc-binding dehydrogenase n=1 Tax=Fundicoccus culcitae TaxID=2969821 RepID=A0ABY5PAH9_9LACT|nr:alcohol dehydrogenase catalytic domain-containing protein [Fundicoccus culcitae]UUX35508.1 zinc-binding dehydrogenase [Fundicoccus culcitae]
MQSVIFNGIRDVDLTMKPVPTPEGGDVLVKVKKAGICGTDVAAYKYGGEHASIQAGDEFGHEMVGEIVSLGKDVSQFKEGDRVFVNPQYFQRMDTKHRGGAFSEYVLVHDAKLDFNLFMLPDNLSYDDAVLIEPFSVGIHGKNIPNVTADSKVVIFGSGTIGLSALTGVIASGVKNPVLTDIDPKRLKTAEELGATTYLTSTDSEFNDFLIGHFGESFSMIRGSVSDADVYIDCAGAPTIYQSYSNLAKNGAYLSVVASHHKDNLVNFKDLMWGEQKIVGSFMYNTNDIKEAIQILSDGKTKITSIITQKYPQSQAKEALEIASDTSQSIKVVIDYDL